MFFGLCRFLEHYCWKDFAPFLSVHSMYSRPPLPYVVSVDDLCLDVTRDSLCKYLHALFAYVLPCLRIMIL